ncbi:DUF3237 domain-containing protein [Aquibacillus saliphilus]|uniref:DUF3237 domain-containing protein n=1 Tax=Aquibacillus saliphilus TaxID=1909422 RepID=UPI001CF08C0E|nr:DUF3237 domain-containing protein [Aquibacillus saliphilus]
MDFRTELAMKLIVYCDQELEIGQTYTGVRRVVPIIGGTFEGPGVNGIVLPGGADWNLTRSDGTGEVWARYTLQANDGALISVINQGKSYIKSLTKKNDKMGTPEEDVYIYTTPSFEVSGEKYSWLNTNMFIGTLEPHPKGVQLHFFRIV